MPVHHSPPEWRISPEPVPYLTAVAEMEQRARSIRDKDGREMVWLLEHPPLYTAGTSARPSDLLQPNRFPVFQTGRGGQFTYHGPGQRVGYVMLDLNRRGPDVRAFVRNLEQWVIGALEKLGIKAERRAGRIGLWVARPGREDKIAAIGVRLRKWVTYHGVAINLDPDLSHFSGIVPCGVRSGPDLALGVTSLADLGVTATMADLDNALKSAFDRAFAG